MSRHRVVSHERIEGVFWVTQPDGTKKLATINLALGRSVYGEKILQFKGREYRLWDPYRSKLAAAIHRGLDSVPLWRGEKVLYLGAASGTTASHISDIIGLEGRIYCVEFSQRVMRELMGHVAAYRPNIIPILADARKPEDYRMTVERVDLIYCDIAQPEQAKILADNSDIFLKDGGWIMLAIKASSIDATKAPSEIFRREIATLENRGFLGLRQISLEPYDKAHLMVVAQYRRRSREE
ncbi:MAG: fibrillarin-like rRNA/tRNA 2'-O-methyltransferase [Candidatus Bathyarchaeia archaeon]